MPTVMIPSRGQLWQVPLLLTGILALLAVWLTRPLWYDPQARQLQRDLAAVRQMLEDPQASASELTTQSDELLGHIDSLPKRAGEAQFLAGSAYLRLARVLPPDQAAA